MIRMIDGILQGGVDLKRHRRALLTLTCMLVILSLPATAYAGLDVPSSVWNLATQGQYNFSGVAEISDLYSNYLFTGVSSAKIYCQNKRTDKNLTVKLIRDDPVFDTTVSTVYVPKNGSSTWTVTGLSTSNKYYLKFYAPSNFSGYIKKP
ncbi:MAG: hypothetical protein N3B11_03365 [Coriobacteriia bacterium]|nr:hypothetical protein [Coriobacteriia bacterium]